MRIAFVTPEFITEASSFDGGLSNYLGRVSIGLRDEGHQPTIFVAADQDELIDWHGIPVQRVKVGSTGLRDCLRKIWHLSGDCLSLSWLRVSRYLNLALRRKHESEQFDIVQYSSYGATAYYRLRSIPAVVRLSSYEKLRREALAAPGPTRDTLRHERFERRAICNGDRIFGPSKLTIDAVERDIKRRVAFIPTPFFVETNRLDTEAFESFLRGKTYFLFFGSLSKLKGVELIVEILAELLQNNPGLCFVFVGKDLGAGPGVKARQERFPDRILYFDRLPHSQLYPIIREALAVVLPSLYDNCPNACMEAMAFGRPVIGSENAGFEELLAHGRTGLMCRRGSSADLLRTLKEFLELPFHRRASMGEAAAQRVAEFRPKFVIPQLIDFYREVVSHRQPAPR